MTDPLITLFIITSCMWAVVGVPLYVDRYPPRNWKQGLLLVVTCGPLVWVYTLLKCLSYPLINLWNRIYNKLGED